MQLCKTSESARGEQKTPDIVLVKIPEQPEN
jgi:hypothetical protein